MWNKSTINKYIYILININKYILFYITTISKFVLYET